MAVRLFYLDDSGAEDTGYVTYSWVEVDITDWRTGLRTWLDWRHAISERYRIPVQAELHATQFIGGRGNPSLDERWNRQPAQRLDVATEALRVVGSTPCLSVGTVYRRTTARRRAFHTQRTEVYEQLVHLIDGRLITDGDLGILIMDGDGSDPSYVSAHRSLKLSTRAIIEDPVFQHSHVSQWVQIADLVAWVTYQHLLRHPGKRHVWDWYQTYLERCDVYAKPRAV